MLLFFAKIINVFYKIQKNAINVFCRIQFLLNYNLFYSIIIIQFKIIVFLSNVS